MVLRSTFPTAALKVTPVGQLRADLRLRRPAGTHRPHHPHRRGVLPEGHQQHDRRRRQQVLLHVKVMEVSRTKLRQLGFDFSQITGPNVITSGPTGLLSNAVNSTPVVRRRLPCRARRGRRSVVTRQPGGTFAFGVVNGNSAFFGVLDALRQDNLVKIMAEPTLVTVSGRPAFQSPAGSFHRPARSGRHLQSIHVNYGTQVDFVPIVLGNGKNPLGGPARYQRDRPQPHRARHYPGLLKRDSGYGRGNAGRARRWPSPGWCKAASRPRTCGLPWISEVPYLGAAVPQGRRTDQRGRTADLGHAGTWSRRWTPAKCRRAGRACRPPAPAIGNCS